MTFPFFRSKHTFSEKEEQEEKKGGEGEEGED